MNRTNLNSGKIKRKFRMKQKNSPIEMPYAKNRLLIVFF